MKLYAVSAINFSTALLDETMIKISISDSKVSSPLATEPNNIINFSLSDN